MKYALNENIRRLRLLHGINQVEFAKAVGVTKQCVSNWENDNVLPSVEMLIRIADFFGVTTDSLLGRASDKTIDATGLLDEQAAHIRLLITDMKRANEK